MKRKKKFKRNILNSFFITVLKYQDMGRQHPIPAPVRLEAEGPLYLVGSLTGFNKPLRRDDPIRANTTLLVLHVLGPGKGNAGFLPFDFAKFLKRKIRWYLWAD